MILRPINEHINDLYIKHDELGNALSMTEKVVEGHNEQLERQNQGLARLEGKHILLETELKALQKELKGADLIRKVTALETESRANKKSQNGAGRAHGQVP